MQQGTWCGTGYGWNLLILLSLFTLPTLALATSPKPRPEKTTPAVGITTAHLADGKRGLAYFQQLAVSGGTAPYTWSIDNGSRLPMGLKINPTAGTIAGYPVREGSSVMTVRVTDSGGNSATRDFRFDVLLVPGELWSWSPGATSLPVDEMDGVITAAEGQAHYAALRYDGTVWTWGDNSGNQLGRGGNRNGKSPIPGIDNAVAIAAGKEHTAVLTQDGTVREFGNYWGTSRTFANTGFIALSGGDYYTVALKEDGTVWTWLYDQAPRQLTGFPRIVAIAAGRSYLANTPDLALAEDGSVWTWTFKAPAPAKLPSPTDVVAIANSGGGYLLKADGTIHGTTINGVIAVSETAAIQKDGTVWYHPDHGAATPVKGLSGATAITRTTALVPYGASSLPAAPPFSPPIPPSGQALALSTIP